MHYKYVEKLKIKEKKELGVSTAGVCSVRKERVPAESRVLHFTSMTHRMAISKADMRGKCLLLHSAEATTEGAISSKDRAAEAVDEQWR